MCYSTLIFRQLSRSFIHSSLHHGRISQQHTMSVFQVLWQTLLKELKRASIAAPNSSPPLGQSTQPCCYPANSAGQKKEGMVLHWQPQSCILPMMCSFPIAEKGVVQGVVKSAAVWGMLWPCVSSTIISTGFSFIPRAVGTSITQQSIHTRKIKLCCLRYFIYLSILSPRKCILIETGTEQPVLTQVFPPQKDF